jgi:hypothetical protein
MWAIDNRTPYRAGKTWARDKNGVHEWIVCVKATFDIAAAGEVRLADEQIAPLLAPAYNGEPGTSSLKYDADLVPLKPTTDVVLNGTAYAPGGRPSTEFAVAMRVGALQKVLKVRGNRTWLPGPFGGGPSRPEPVTRVPIIYERAYGGYHRDGDDPRHHRMDARNPVGCGLAPASGERAGQPLPNFEYANGEVESSGPAGFAAIDCYWSPRRELAGTYDTAWENQRCPLLPQDWDPRSLLCAPADQRPGYYLHGGELVELVNLTPGGHLRFALPKIHLTFRTRIRDRAEEHRARLTTVILEPDYPRVMLSWLTSIQCLTDVDYLEQTVVRQKPYLK